MLAATMTAGCTLFRKSNRPKESPAISSEVEETFRRRWIEKRVAELAAQGVASPAAEAQADNEFRERFGFTRGGNK
jgi:hypothetical protein